MTPSQLNIPYGYCHCGCGRKTTIIQSSNSNLGRVKGEPSQFISGHNTSPRFMSEVQTRHGHAKQSGPSGTYVTWMGMKGRCLNVNSKDYPRYGGRGITICGRWLVFDNFLADMGERPLGLSIERIANNGNYEPGNCRWATIVEQNRNKRSSNRLPWNGRVYTVSELAHELGLPRPTLQARLRAGWPIEKAVKSDYKRRSTLIV